MVDKPPIVPQDLIDTTFSGDRWRARDNYNLAKLVLFHQSPYNEGILWQDVCDSLARKTGTEFQPHYLTPLACEMQYNLLIAFVVKRYLALNRTPSTRAEMTQLLIDAFYMKMMRDEDAKVKESLATMGTWHELQDEVKAGRITKAVAACWAREALPKIKEAIGFKCPCPEFLQGIGLRRSCIDDSLTAPVDEAAMMQHCLDTGETISTETGDKVSEGSMAASDSTLQSALTSPAAGDSSKGSTIRGRTAIHKVLIALWDLAATHCHAAIFEKPVVNVENYEEVVLKPTCLLMIRKDIRAGVIKTIPELRAALTRMFANALVFNSISDPMYLHMVKMSIEVLENFDINAENVSL